METCFANWPLILEYLKVFLSWPPVVLLIVLLLTPTLAPTITELARKLRKGKAAGFEFELDQEQKAPPLPSLDAGDQLSQIAHDPARARSEILKWWNAARAENAFNRIFGTQVRMLEFLESKEPSGVVEAELQPFYTEHQKIVDTLPNAQGSPSWAAFVGFLQSYGYVVYEERNGLQYVRITTLGIGFLSYIKATWGAIASTRAG